ncbi:MAG: hypothetical protein ABSE51_13435 [Terracidiphilus sp.]
MLDTVAQSHTDLVAPITIAPIHNQSLTSEVIDVKPVTIAPIQISALN